MVRKSALASAAAFAALIVLPLAGCSTDAGGQSPAGSAGDQYGLLTAGVITAGTQSEQPPFAFAAADGKPQGFAIDLAEEAAKRLGLRIEYKITNLQGILAGLSANQYDVGVAGVGATDERKKTVDFVRPYFWSFTAVLTKASSLAKSLDDFGGAKVGVVSGSVQETFANTKLPGASIVKFKDQPSAIGQLVSGGIDAFVVGGPDATEYVTRDPSLKIAAEADTTQGTSFPVRKGNVALVTALDQKIDEMILDGTYMTFYQKWFKHPLSPKLVEFRPGLAKVVAAQSPTAG